jgi:hypothetical protein
VTARDTANTGCGDWHLYTLQCLHIPANELARSGDAGVGALCRFAHAPGRHPASSTVAGITGTYRLLIYHLIASSVHHQSRHKPSIFHSRFPSHLHILPCTQRWQGSPPAPRSRHEKRDGTFSSPPPIPYSSAVSVAAPCVGAPGCHGFSPLQATWPMVQFRQLTKPGCPGFRQSHGAD